MTWKPEVGMKIVRNGFNANNGVPEGDIGEITGVKEYVVFVRWNLAGGAEYWEDNNPLTKKAYPLIQINEWDDSLELL